MSNPQSDIVLQLEQVNGKLPLVSCGSITELLLTEPSMLCKFSSGGSLKSTHTQIWNGKSQTAPLAVSASLQKLSSEQVNQLTEAKSKRSIGTATLSVNLEAGIKVNAAVMGAWISGLSLHETPNGDDIILSLELSFDSLAIKDLSVGGAKASGEASSFSSLSADEFPLQMKIENLSDASKKLSKEDVSVLRLEPRYLTGPMNFSSTRQDMQTSTNGDLEVPSGETHALRTLDLEFLVAQPFSQSTDNNAGDWLAFLEMFFLSLSFLPHKYYDQVTLKELKFKELFSSGAGKIKLPEIRKNLQLPSTLIAKGVMIHVLAGSGGHLGYIPSQMIQDFHSAVDGAQLYPQVIKINHPLNGSFYGVISSLQITTKSFRADSSTPLLSSVRMQLAEVRALNGLGTQV